MSYSKPLSRKNPVGLTMRDEGCNSTMKAWQKFQRVLLVPKPSKFPFYTSVNWQILQRILGREKNRPKFPSRRSTLWPKVAVTLCDFGRDWISISATDVQEESDNAGYLQDRSVYHGGRQGEAHFQIGFLVCLSSS